MWIHLAKCNFYSSPTFAHMISFKDVNVIKLSQPCPNKGKLIHLHVMWVILDLGFDLFCYLGNSAMSPVSLLSICNTIMKCQQGNGNDKCIPISCYLLADVSDKMLWSSFMIFRLDTVLFIKVILFLIYLVTPEWISTSSPFLCKALMSRPYVPLRLVRPQITSLHGQQEVSFYCLLCKLTELN